MTPQFFPIYRVHRPGSEPVTYVPTSCDDLPAISPTARALGAQLENLSVAPTELSNRVSNVHHPGLMRKTCVFNNYLEVFASITQPHFIYAITAHTRTRSSSELRAASFIRHTHVNNVYAISQDIITFFDNSIKQRRVGTRHLWRPPHQSAVSIETGFSRYSLQRRPLTNIVS